MNVVDSATAQPPPNVGAVLANARIHRSLSGRFGPLGPLDIPKAVIRSFIWRRVFEFKIRLGPPILAESVKEERNYKDVTERMRQALRILADGIRGQPDQIVPIARGSDRTPTAID